MSMLFCQLWRVSATMAISMAAPLNRLKLATVGLNDSALILDGTVVLWVGLRGIT
jgi:hypothetical protein